MSKKTDESIKGTLGTIAELPNLPPQKEFRQNVWELTSKYKFDHLSDIIHSLPDILFELDELDYKALIHYDRDNGGYVVQVFEEIRYSKGDPKPKHLLTLYDDISIPQIGVSYGTMKTVSEEKDPS